MLVTFDNLKKDYTRKINEVVELDSNMKHIIVAQNVRKIDYLEKVLKEVKSQNNYHHYSEEFFNAGKYLAIQRLKYEIELLYAYNNEIFNNHWVVNHDMYSTEHILNTLNKIINK